MNNKKALVILPIFLVVFLSFASLPVKAQPEKQWINVFASSDFGLRNQIITVTALANLPQINISIYDPDNIKIYSQIWNSNTSRNLPISPTSKYGTYTITGLNGNVSSNSWFTVLDITDWSAATFPYLVEHKNVRYTFFANWTVKAEALTSSDKLLIDFSFIRDLTQQYDLSITPTKNSMNLRIRLSRTPYFIADLDFAFIHKGMKFIINGTQNVQRTFTLSLGLNDIQSLKSIISGARKGILVFDWSDLQRIGAIHNFDKNIWVLSITAPTNFNLDPYLFSDGFESGDFSAWTGGTAQSGAVISVSSETASIHHGSYGCKITGLDADADYGMAKTGAFTGQTTIFMRAYVKVSSTLATDTKLLIPPFVLGTEPTQFFCALIYNNGGTYYWQVEDYAGGHYYTSAASFTFVANEWYCIELKAVVSTTVGELRLYVNGVEVITQTGLNTGSTSMTLARVEVLQVGNANVGTVYVDCCAVDSAPIGSDALSFTGSGSKTLTVSYSVSRLAEFIRSSTFTFSEGTTTERLLEMLYSPSLTISNLFSASKALEMFEQVTLAISTAITGTLERLFSVVASVTISFVSLLSQYFGHATQPIAYAALGIGTLGFVIAIMVYRRRN